MHIQIPAGGVTGAATMPSVIAAALLVLLAGCREVLAPVNCLQGELLGSYTTVTGALTANDCRIGADAGEPHRYEDYTIWIVRGETYFVNLHADGAWVPSLEIRDADDAAVPRLLTGMWDGGRNSQLAFVSPSTGRYRLRVRTQSGEGGAFTLTQRPCFGASGPLSGSGGTIVGALTTGDCVLRDRYLPADSTPADLYTLDLVAGARKEVRIKATGTTTFQPALIVRYNGPDATYREVSLAASDSLVITLDVRHTGRYLLAVGSFSPTRLGEYSLTVGPSSSP